MAPSRRKGGSKAAAAAAARRQWKVGDLVLAKVKGFPAWPAKVGEPESLGFAADWKKVVVRFFGTKPEQIGFCNPADVEAFTEEKKQSLLVKRHGRSADFLRAVQEIIDSYEKLKKQDQLNDFNAGDEVTPANNANSVDLLPDLGSNDQTEVPEVTPNSQLKTSYSTTDKTKPGPPLEDTLAATAPVALVDKEALGEECTDNALVTETPLPTTYSSKKRSSLLQPQSCVTHRKAQRSRSSSRLESRRPQSFTMPFNDGGKNARDISANVVRDGSLRRNKRIRKSPDVSESDDAESTAFVSNGSIEENSYEILTVDSDTFSQNEVSTIESGCKHEQSNTVVECLDADVELSKGLDLQIKAVFIKKKRKPNRKRVTSETAGAPTTLDKEIGLEVGEQNNCQNSQRGCEKMKETCLKDDGDEHLPLVKRARVRMGKSSYVEEELNGSLHTEERTIKEVAVDPSGQISMHAKCDDDNLADRDSLVVNGAPDNVSSPSKHCTQVLVSRPQLWKVKKEQSFGCSVDGEAALPPSKRLNRALEAMSANAAEEGQTCNEASPTLKTVGGISSMERGPHMAVGSKAGNCLGLLSMDSLGNISPQVGVSGSSTSLNPIISEDNVKSSMEVDFCNQPVDVLKIQQHERSKDVFADARDDVGGSSVSHAVRTTVPTQSLGYLSPNLDERQANPGSNETSMHPLSPPKDEDDTKNNELSNCNAEISDKEVGNSENTGMSLGLVSRPNEILQISPRIGTIVLQYSAEGTGCEDNKCLKPPLDDKEEVNGMYDIMKELKNYQTLEDPSSNSFSDDHLGEKDISGVPSSPSLTDAGDSLPQASPPHTSNYNMSTSDSSNFVQNNGSCSPDVHLHHKRTLCAPLDEEEKIESSMTQRPKSVGKHGEAHVALSSFEAMLGTLTRTKESIGRATRVAIDCAKFGVAAKVVEILTHNLETESSLHRRVDLFFLVDSITQCSRGLKGDVAGIFPSAIQAVLPRLLSAAAPPGNTAHENRKQCLRVLRLWLERKILPESIVRHHMRELDSLSGSSSAGPYSRRSARTERALDDPVREMEGMLVDEYGSNSSFQLPGFCMPRMLKDDNEGSDSDGESFEAVTPEHNLEAREERESIPAIEKHRHILEDVDGELEMEDVAPSCEVETNSSFHVAEVNAVQTLHGQCEQHVPLSFAPPLPQDVPPSSPPLPSSPPPPPPPPVPTPSAMSDPYTNGVDSKLYMDTHNMRDNLVQSVAQQPIAPRVDQTMHYRSPECRDPQMQMPESASCSFSNYSVQPVNNGRHTNGATLHDTAYTLRPPHPAPSNQFSYFHGDQHVRPRRDAPPPSYSNRYHFVQNVERENSCNSHERIKPPPYEHQEHWRFPAPPFSGPRYPDKGKTSYAHVPYEGPPCEPPRLPGQGWRFPPRTMNHRNAIPFRPPFEGPIPVAGRGPSFWRPR